jgi:hypothetical protein
LGKERRRARTKRARGWCFVGRAKERALFRSLIRPGSNVQVLYLYGPGGIGKTTLLAQLSKMCSDAKVGFARVDARHFEPTLDSMLASLAESLKLRGSKSPLDSLESAKKRNVIFLDTYERFAALDAWIREVPVQRLGRNLLVIAGRELPDAGWRALPEWRASILPLELRNLDRANSRRLLEACGVPEGRRAAVLAFTFGHPLALALAADALHQDPDTAFGPEPPPDLVRALVQQFVGEGLGPAHREALEACALVRSLNESLLAQMLGQPDVHALFEWLRGLSFVESGPRGLHPHDLTREVLAADLRWRHPDRYTALTSRALDVYIARCRSAPPAEQQQVALDDAFLLRHVPTLKNLFDADRDAALTVGVATPREHPSILAMAEKHEGPVASNLAAAWLTRQPHRAFVVRDRTGEPVAFTIDLILAPDDPALLDPDPATRALSAYLDQSGGMPPGRVAVMSRS